MKDSGGNPLDCGNALMSNMAENARTSLALRLHFALGFFEGALVGLGVATMLHRVMSPAKLASNNASDVASQPVSSLRAKGEILLKRESAEAAGDPSQLVTANAAQVKPEFQRTGGSPGPVLQGEVLERPGRPGQPLPNGDASKPVQPASRTLHVS